MAPIKYQRSSRTSNIFKILLIKHHHHQRRQKPFLQCKPSTRGDKAAAEDVEMQDQQSGFSITLKFGNCLSAKSHYFTLETVKSNQNLPSFSFFCMHMGYFVRRFLCPVLYYWKSPGLYHQRAVEIPGK